MLSSCQTVSSSLSIESIKILLNFDRGYLYNGKRYLSQSEDAWPLFYGWVSGNPSLSPESIDEVLDCIKFEKFDIKYLTKIVAVSFVNLFFSSFV